MMLVRDLLRKKSAKLITIAPNADVHTAVRLLLDHNVGGLPVVAGGTLVGFISERDVVRAVDANAALPHMSVDRIMQPAPLCRTDDSLQQVMERMTRERLRHLVVVDQSGTAGVISVGDIVKHRLEELETETGTLRDYVAAQRAVR